MRVESAEVGFTCMGPQLVEARRVPTVLILKRKCECVVCNGMVSPLRFHCFPFAPCYSRIWLGFKCQGVPTLSFDEYIDGVPQPLSI